MKFRKPQDGARWFVNIDLIGEDARELQRFVESLPDEFEILGPRESAVKWPKECTKQELSEWCDDLTRYMPANADILRYLRALAAIAPEKKKRRVSLWEAGGRIHVWGEHDTAGYPWRKVAGPIEIDD